MTRNRCISLLLLVFVAMASSAADWPQWRHDHMRSGATEEALRPEMELQWKLTLGRPDPAFTHQYRMCADYSYAPVAADGLLFVPSNVTDQVMGLDLATGKLAWRCVTDGPVRFAPAFSDGKLYFSSDDGYLHCVNAKTGELLWRRRGVPEHLPDMLMLVNGRMVSRWPARGGPVVSHGRVFFGAGIWPEEGAYVSAVDAATGKLIWRSDALSIIKEGMCDHGSNLDLSLPPQGYMAVIGGKLCVTSGRTLAAWFDPATGTLDPYTSFYVKKSNPRGTWYVVANDDFWVQGGNWFGTRPGSAPSRPENTIPPLSWSRKSPTSAEFQLARRPFLTADVNTMLGGEVYYSEPVLTEDTSYAAVFADERRHLVLNGETVVRFDPFDKIVARDLSRPEWKTLRAKVDMGGTEGSDVSVVEFPVEWQMDTSMRVLMGTASHLVAGEAGRIAAIAIPVEGDTAEISWEASIDGNPINTLLADGNLVTVTDTGRIYCFGSGPAHHSESPHFAPAEHAPGRGYAFVLGTGDLTALLALATDPEWRVVVLERPGDKLVRAREALCNLGLYGRRAHVIPARPGIQFTPYWASRVIVNDTTLLGTPERTLTVATDALRPFTGQMPMTPAIDRTTLASIIAGRTGFELQGSVLARISAPEGAADWTHETAQGDNSFVGRDKLVKWPLGVLWYSGDLDRYLPPFTDLTHIRSPYPLVKGGRLFMFTHEALHAVDVYTGNYLWSRQLPATPYVNTRRFLNRLYGKPTERSYLLADNGIYCITGEQIHVYDPATGEPTRVLSVPRRLRDEATRAAGHRMTKKMRDYDDHYEIQPVPEWTEARLWGGSIVAKLGNTVAAVDRRSGELLWSRVGTLDTTVCAIGGDTLYGLDCVPDEHTRDQEQFTRTGRLFALNLEDGAERWSRQVSYPSWPQGVSKGITPWMKKAMPSLGYNAKHGLLAMTYNGLSATVFRAADGGEVWSRRVNDIAEPAWNYTPNILDDHLMMSLSKYQGGMGVLLDIRTGQKLQGEVSVPRARTCGRMVGNHHLLSYRDGATELYDVDRDLTIPLNSLRTGCTTSFIPACGVMSAPMMAHGCVCNYPMFASLAMVHMPEIDRLRPKAVLESWGADQQELIK